MEDIQRNLLRAHLLLADAHALINEVTEAEQARGEFAKAAGPLEIQIALTKLLEDIYEEMERR